MEFIIWLAVGVVIGLGLGFARRRAGGPIAIHTLVSAVGALAFGAIFLPLLGLWLKKLGMANPFASGPGAVAVIEALVGAIVVYGLVTWLSKRADAKRKPARDTGAAVAA